MSDKFKLAGVFLSVLLTRWCGAAEKTPDRPVAQPDMRLNVRVANDDWKQMARPVVEGVFVRPAETPIAQPIWGHAKGLQVGLYPMQGPRGLLRIYTPYLGQDEGKMINFIAIEPTREGESKRALSEMERSELDLNAPGKRFWPTNSPDDVNPKLPEEQPARGVVSREGEVDFLRLSVMVERCRNGTHPYMLLTFRSDRPHEVGIALFAHKDSALMSTCIASATMGNFARLRELHLAGQIAQSTQLWPNHRDNTFTTHKRFELTDLYRTPEGAALVAATPDEQDPSHVVEGFHRPFWRYTGKKATQYWRCEDPDPALHVLVNGRFTYFNSKTAIPGGVSYENFEMVAPFKEGQEFWFGVTEKKPEELGLPQVSPNGMAGP